jgi:thymidylate synthase (FAD)
MKIIEQSYEFITEKNIERKIELVARTCYKSENKITEGSAEKLVKKLRDLNHSAMFEFADIIINVDKNTFDKISKIYIKESGYITSIRNLKFTDFNNRYIISGDIRAWRDLLKKYKFFMFIKKLIEVSSVLFSDLLELSDLDYNFFHTIDVIDESDLSYEEFEIHASLTMKLIINRGCSHEIVRHWLAVAQESTRYVNYYNDDINFIKPVWLSNGLLNNNNPLELDKIESLFYTYLLYAEEGYKKLIENGQQAQQAREILPNALKTEINLKTSISHWRYILDLRSSKGVHPQLKDIIKKIKKKFDRLYVIKS